MFVLQLWCMGSDLQRIPNLRHFFPPQLLQICSVSLYIQLTQGQVGLMQKVFSHGIYHEKTERGHIFAGKEAEPLKLNWKEGSQQQREKVMKGSISII